MGLKALCNVILAPTQVQSGTHSGVIALNSIHKTERVREATKTEEELAYYAEDSSLAPRVGTDKRNVSHNHARMCRIARILTNCVSRQ